MTLIRSKRGPLKERVHFINTGAYGDCILLEDNGKFALVDTGINDTTTSIPNIVNYLKKMNITELEFVIITHPHKDHIGGFVDIFANNIKIKGLYIKNYENIIANSKYDGVVNKTLYNNVIKMCNDYQIPITYVNSKMEGTSIYLNKTMKITFYNTYRRLYLKGSNNGANGTSFSYKKAHFKKNLNVDSIVTLITATNTGHTALLTGDLNNYYIHTHLINKIVKKYGQIDVYKLGHHGQNNSTGLNASTARHKKLNVKAKYLVATQGKSQLLKKDQAKTFKYSGNAGRIRRNGKTVSLNSKCLFYSLDAPNGAIIFNIGNDPITHSKYNR